MPPQVNPINRSFSRSTSTASQTYTAYFLLWCHVRIACVVSILCPIVALRLQKNAGLSICVDMTSCPHALVFQRNRLDATGDERRPADTPSSTLVEVVESDALWLAYLGQWGTTPSPATQRWFLNAEVCFDPVAVDQSPL